MFWIPQQTVSYVDVDVHSPLNIQVEYNVRKVLVLANKDKFKG